MSEERDVVFVLDDEPDMLRGIQRMLVRMGYSCHTETDPQRALRRIEEIHPDLLLTDLRLPEMSGLDVLRHARRVQPGLVVILITAYATIDTAVEAIRHGAYDYIPKPFSPEQLRGKVERGLAAKHASARLSSIEDANPGDPGALVIGEAPAFKSVMERVRLVAGADASILLQGESGTGKEVVARRIHALSPRRERDFIPIDCSALSETLLESELFGFEKGAFTGADTARPGLFEYADGGTVFLDEVGEIPAGLQSRLLRVLQEHSFRRVGGREEHRVDIRVIAATNLPLDAAVSNGRFREDLYYRLNCISLKIPPLRERRRDISLLAHHFLKKHSRGAALDQARLAPETLDALLAYPWPGNVRELENAIRRALAFKHEGRILPEDLPDVVVGEAVHDPEAGRALEDVRRRIERAHIQQVLEETGGHRGRAAEILGISRKTLWDKMKTLGID